MAESSNKPGIFAKAQKTISRTKTKVLQNLGRAEKTTDDTFTDNVQKIDKQQEVAHHLQKELKAYVHCIKDLCQASKSLQTALQDTYESDWTEEAQFKSHLQTMDLLWTDFMQNVQDSAMVPLHTYLMSFPVLKNKIAKRGRKLVDFDNARHHLEGLQAAKKKDELKINKAQDDLKEAKKIYEDLNNELHVELPDFYNSRVSFYADVFTNLFGAEYTFHTELGKSNGALGDISQQLGKDYASYIYQPKRPLSKSLSTSDNGLNGDTSGMSTPSSTLNSPVTSTAPASVKGDSTQPTYTNDSAADTGTSVNITSGFTNGDDRTATAASSPPPTTATSQVGDGDTASEVTAGYTVSEVSEDAGKNKLGNGELSSPEDNNVYEEPKQPERPKVPPSPAKRPEVPPSPKVKESAQENEVKKEEEEESQTQYEDDDDTYSSPPSNRPVISPPENTMYQVQATHRYNGEDVDELTFDPGEVIYVIPFENPEEQDDGWQMGIKQSDGVKGVFPENFTTRVKDS